MPKPGCSLDNCAYQPLPLAERLIVSAVAAGIVVIRPMLNAMGVAMNENLANALPVLNGSVILFFLAWVGSIYLAWKEATDHHWTLVLNAMGLPGTLLGLALLFSK